MTDLETPMTAGDRAAAIVARALEIQGTVSIADGMHTLPAWNSLAHARLMLELEAELGRQLDSEELAGIVSVAAVARLLG